MAKSYEKAGVNLEAGYEVVRRIKQHVSSTERKGSMGNIGSFGGMFDLSNKGPSSQSYGFSSSHIWMIELDHKES